MVDKVMNNYKIYGRDKNYKLLSFLVSMIIILQWIHLQFMHFFAATSVNGNWFAISSVSRTHIGAYFCIASNNIPPSVSKRIELKVQCKNTIISIGHSKIPYRYILLIMLNTPSRYQRYSLTELYIIFQLHLWYELKTNWNWHMRDNKILPCTAQQNHSHRPSTTGNLAMDLLSAQVSHLFYCVMWPIFTTVI